MLALAVVGFAACGSSARNARAYVAENALEQERFAARPSTLSFSLDGDLEGRRLTWIGWGGSAATARGTFVYEEHPTGATTSVPGSVTLSGVKSCRGARYYSAAAVHAPGGPWAPAKSISFTTPC